MASMLARLSCGCLVAGALSALAPSIVAQQAPAPARSVIVGQVVDADSGRGVPAAVIQVGPLLKTMGPSGTYEESLGAYSFGMRFIVADGQGRFVVRGVPAGTYALVVRSSGYMFSSYGQQRPGGPTREIAIDGTQRVNDIVIKAWKYGVISGTVLDEAGEPAVGVMVRAWRRTFAAGHSVFTPTFAATRTDDRGEYRLIELEPGDYAVGVVATSVTVPTATLAAYRDAAAAGNTAITLRMQREAGDLGSQLSNASRVVDGEFTLLGGSGTRGLLLPPDSANGSVYQTVFHPSSADLAQASILTLGSGEERPQTSISLKVARAFRVSGRVTAPDGAAGILQVSLMAVGVDQLAHGGPEAATTISDENGRFRFLSVPEGEYVIKVLRVQRPRAAPERTTSIQTGSETVTAIAVEAEGIGADMSAGVTLWARTGLVVGGDIDDITVPLSFGARVGGRLEFPGKSAPPALWPIASLTLVPADGRQPPDIPAARPRPDRQFVTAQYPPGRYYLMATQPARGWFLKSVTLNGVDVLRTPFTLGSTDLAGATVTFTERPSGLTGSVTDRNAPASDAIVALFPAEYRSWIDAGMPSALARVGNADRTGSFRLDELMPGDYLVVAYPPSVRRSLQDPAFVAELAAAAVRVTIGDSDRKTIALTLAGIR